MNRASEAAGSNSRFVLVWDVSTDAARSQLQQMLAAGINVDAKRLAQPNQILLTTYDASLAEKFGFHPETGSLEKS